MIGTSRSELYFIQACIFFLHFLAPACIAYCLIFVGLYGFVGAIYRAPLLIETIAIAETAFHLFVYIPSRIYLQREAIHPTRLSRTQRRELFTKCNENIPDVEAYLRKWFLGAPIEEIKRDNLKDFFLWAFFDRGGLPGNDDEELEEYIKATEVSMGRAIQPGRGNAECLRLTLDKVDMLHRSLTWYFCVGFVDFLTYIRLQMHGFSFYKLPLSRFFSIFPLRPVALFTKHKSPVKHLTYWHRPHTSRTKLPIVFIHGIGIGLYPYTNFLNELNSSAGVESSDPNDQVGIIALEIMPVSFRLTHAALTREQLCDEASQIITAHFGPTQKFVLVSHSYGTVISTHLLKMSTLAERIGPVVLIDPVSILLHLPDVAYNFTRRKPSTASERQLHYFASMDMGVSHTLARHFFWSENTLWKEDIAGRRVTVSLGGLDLIVNTEAVGNYLGESSNDDASACGTSRADEKRNETLLKRRDGVNTSNVGSAATDDWKTRAWKGEGVEILWWPDLDHAQVFDKITSRKKVLDVIRAYCKAH